MAVERFGNVRARSIEVDSLKVGGVPIGPQAGPAADGGAVTVAGSIDVRTRLQSITSVAVEFASPPPGPGYVVVVAVAKTIFAISVFRPSNDGLKLVPATSPVDLLWTAIGD